MRAQSTLKTRLKELIAALDRRTPHPARTAEGAIAADAAALKRRAQEQLSSLDAATHEKDGL